MQVPQLLWRHHVRRASQGIDGRLGFGEGHDLPDVGLASPCGFTVRGVLAPEGGGGHMLADERRGMIEVLRRNIEAQ